MKSAAFLQRMLGLGIAGLLLSAVPAAVAKTTLPVEEAQLTYAPGVPPPIKRKSPAIVRVHLDSGVQITELNAGVKYAFWTFNDHVPGPFIRARVGDTLEVHVTNSDESGMPHNVDFHAVTGPGGGATVTTVVQGEERVAWFKLLHPGLFIYHCAAPPVMDHSSRTPSGGAPRILASCCLP